MLGRPPKHAERLESYPIPLTSAEFQACANAAGPTGRNLARCMVRGADALDLDRALAHGGVCIEPRGTGWRLTAQGDANHLVDFYNAAQWLEEVLGGSDE